MDHRIRQHNTPRRDEERAHFPRTLVFDQLVEVRQLGTGGCATAALAGQAALRAFAIVELEMVFHADEGRRDGLQDRLLGRRTGRGRCGEQDVGGRDKRGGGKARGEGGGELHGIGLDLGRYSFS